MSILALSKEGIWSLDSFDLEPVEFWPYTTYVQDVAVSAPRNQFDALEKELMQMFKDAGIKAYIENKCAYGLKDRVGRMWYLGFKDFRFDIGLRVSSTDWQNPIRKDEHPK